MRYSLDKIAKELGISKASVSLILNGKARQYAISESLEKRVREFCQSKNYVINAHARRMQQQISGNVGVLIPSGAEVDVCDPFTDFNITEILGGVATSAYGREFQFSIRLYRSESAPEQIFDWVNSRDVDGIICYGYLSRTILRKVARQKFPLVAVGENPGLGVPTVTTDDYAGSRQITEHLLSSGHKKILYIQGIQNSYASQERFRGFCDAVNEAGIKQGENVFGGFSESRCYHIVKEIFQRSADYTAIQCANDIMAVGALRALRESGFRIPEDVAVAGADDIGLASYVSPALTTYPRHLRTLGMQAFSLLYRILDKTIEYSQAQILLPTQMVVREST